MMIMEKKLNTKQDLKLAILAPIILYILSLTVTLITIVDIRRAFLGINYFYRSAWISLSYLHGLTMVLGIAGIISSYKLFKAVEIKVKEGKMLSSVVMLLSISTFVALTIDLVFLYRGVASLRIVTLGSMSIKGETIPASTSMGLFKLDDLHPLAQPVASALNYLAAVWHATFLGILLASLFVTTLSRYFSRLWKGYGNLKNTVVGTMLALPQPFCSCCASPIAASMYRRGAPLSSALSFLLASPMLNVTTLILVVILLPPDFALLRLVTGMFLALPLAYALSLPLERSLRVTGEYKPSESRVLRWITLLLNRYCNLFHFEGLVLEKETARPSGFLKGWFSASWKIARVLLPVFVLGSVFAAFLAKALGHAIGNTPAGVIVAALAGTLLMISTWTEIPVAGILIEEGLTGPAAALLVTLPAVSLPCLVIFGGALGKLRVAAVLGVTVFAVGLILGLLYI